MKTYDPKQVQIIVGGIPLSGFADGSFVTVARAEDAWTMTVGADGEGTRSKSNNKSGTITVVLMQSSQSNQYLSNLVLADEINNAGLVPTMVKDGSGSSLYMAEQSYVKKAPDSDFAKVAGTRTYVIETDNLQMFNGGN